MTQTLIVKHASFAFALLIRASSGMGADDSSDIATLRRDVEEIKAAQKDIQKIFRACKDILSGKQPPLDNVYLDVSGKPAPGNDDAPVSIIEFTGFQALSAPATHARPWGASSPITSEPARCGMLSGIFRWTSRTCWP